MKHRNLTLFDAPGLLRAGNGGSDMAVLGRNMGMAMAEAQASYSRGTLPTAFKEAALTDNLTASIYGRLSIFDPCSPGDVFGLQVQTVGFEKWIGFRPNVFYHRRVDFIPWIGPQGLAGSGTITSGAGAPCDNPNGWEFGVCGYDLYHTSWYHRAGDALDPHTITQLRCETSPRYRINGIQIMDDVEWQMNGIMTVLQQDLRRDIVHGSHNNAYQCDGLESLVKSGYTNSNGTLCPWVDSYVINWGYDDLDGSVNGYGNFFNYLDQIVTNIEFRASGIGTIAETDMVLLTTRFMATCLLDAYACYTTCGVTTLSDITDQALRAQQRAARFALNGGPLYDGSTAVGFIQLKSGRRLPIIVDDFMQVEGRGSNWYTDIYLLTRRVGAIDILYGEYLDMRTYENRVRAQMPLFTARSDAAGRFVTKGKEDNWCIQLIMGTSPELYLSGPWAQARFEHIGCARGVAPQVGDPFQPGYMPGGRPLHKAVWDVLPQNGQE